MISHQYDYERRDGQNCLVRTIGDEEKVIPIDIYGGVDPASSLSMRADFFVVAMVGVDAENNKYIIDIFRDRISPEKQPQKIIDMYKKYKPRRVKIETVGYQEALRTAVREIMRNEDLYIPGLEAGVKPRTRKSERLLSLVPMFAKGQFHWRPQDIEGQKEFMAYPKGKHDDIMDSIWTALDGHRPCRQKEWHKIDENHKIGKKFLDWLTL